MSPGKIVAIGCAGLMGLALLACIGFAAFVAYAGQGMSQASIAVNGPTNVNVGDEFVVNVVVTNSRNKPLTIGDVDLAKAYLDGFTVVSVDPTYVEAVGVPIVNTQSFTFNTEIPANSSQTFAFTLRAQRPGMYTGDVDAYEGVIVITGLLQTVVSEADAAPADPATPAVGD